MSKKEKTKKDNKNKKKKRSLFLPGCLCMIVFGALTGILVLAMGTGRFGMAMFESYFAHTGLLILNLVPPVIVHLFFYMVFGRPWLGFLFGSGLCFALGFAQDFKLTKLGDVILFEDFLKGGEGLGFLPSLKTVSLNWLMIICLIYFMAVLVLLAVLFRGRRGAWPGGRLILAIVLVALFIPYYHIAASPESYGLDVDNTASVDTRSDMQVYVSRGLFYPFALSAGSGDPNEAPGGYSKAKAAEMLASYSDAAIPSEQAVDIIVVQLESFADFSGLVKTTAYDDLAYIRKQAASGKFFGYYFGQDSFGAGLNVLTGYSRLPGIRKPVESYVRYLSRQGYDCWGMHPDWPDIYSRARTARDLGFAEFSFYGEEFAALGKMPDPAKSDWMLFGNVYSRYQEKAAEGKRQFIYVETTQNCGPYVLPEDQRTADEASDTVTAYLEGLRDTLFYLRHFLSRLKEDDKPVVVLIYGDNKPDLGQAAYEKLGMPGIYDEAADPAVRYSGNYYIWANDAAAGKLGKQFSGSAPEISMNYLMQEVFARCGYKGSVFSQISAEFRQSFNIITPERMDLLSTGSGLIRSGDLTLDQQTVYYNYLYKEYYSAYR